MKENAGYIQFKNNDKLTAEIAINMSIPSPTSHFIFGIFCIAINAVTNIIIMMITTVYKKRKQIVSHEPNPQWLCTCELYIKDSQNLT